jgi:hypothetical protein
MLVQAKQHFLFIDMFERMKDETFEAMLKTAKKSAPWLGRDKSVTLDFTISFKLSNCFRSWLSGMVKKKIKSKDLTPVTTLFSPPRPSVHHLEWNIQCDIFPDAVDTCLDLSISRNLQVEGLQQGP